MVNEIPDYKRINPMILRRSGSKYIILSLAVIGLIFVSGCTQNQQKQPLTTSDFSISNFKYEPKEGEFFDSIYMYHDKILRVKASFIISTNKEKLYFKVYDIHDKSLLATAFPSKGDSKLDISGLILDYLYQQPQIKICAVSIENGFYDFDESSPEAVCKIETFPSAKIDVAVNPDVFTVSQKDDDYSYNYKTITVTNTGNVPMSFFLEMPQLKDYPTNYPLYSIKDWRYLHLFPGQSDTYSIAPIPNSHAPVYGFWSKTPTNTYDSMGYIGAINSGNATIEYALFKKEFKLRTTVTE